MTPFTLSVSDLTNLGQDRAVEFFRRLLWAEAARVDIGRHLIDVPDCINVGDGGIDAFVDDATPSIAELIPRGASGFQIKSSDLSPGACRRELHQEEGLDKPIKPEVKNVLDKGGTYVLVLFAEITKRQRTGREQALKEEFADLGYGGPKFCIYTANQLAGFAERFPALVAWFKNELSQCLPYSSWSQRRDVKIPQNFIFDNERERWIREARRILREPSDRCPVFRVVGPPGIGKTRLVFEALSPDDLKNSVIYVTADQFRLSTLYNILQNDENLSAIVVVDECDVYQHDGFVRSFSGRGSRLAVFTLSYDMGRVPSPSITFELDVLGIDRIEEMIKTEAPELPGDVARRLSEFADGYPLIAILLVGSYSMAGTSSEDFLTISDDGLMNRLIGGGMDVNSDHFRRTKRVLTGLSLFQKVGHKGELSTETEWLAEHIDIARGDFEEIVLEQKRRGIIKGEYYIYVRPFMLRVHLLKEWWEVRGLTNESLNEFIGSIPEELRNDLVQRFFDNIPYITVTEQGRGFTEVILSERGLFSDGSALKTKLGADFFLKLAEADPESAMRCLKRTVGTWSKPELLQFTTGRREVVWSLERIAMWGHLFTDGAKLLLALGESENETRSNNASGVFAQLFSLAPRPVAPTEAPPQERFPVLEEALTSSLKERRLLALRSCDQALKSQHLMRTIGNERQGLRREPQLWKPETYGELFDAYRQVWQLLRERLDYLPEDEQQQAVNILLTRARGLARIPNLAGMVIETVGELTKKTYADDKEILANVIRILRFGGREMPDEVRQRWEQIKENLTGTGFSSLMKRYIRVSIWEDRIDERGRPTGKVRKYIGELAQQAVENKDLLRPELDWLATNEAQNGHQFGYELGNRDTDSSLLPELIEAQRAADENASVYFLSGYFHALFERDQQRWEEQLDAVAEDAELNLWLPELTWRSGMSDRAALRVFDLVEKGIIGINQLRIFGAIQELSEAVFEKWIRFLLNSSDTQAVSIGLGLCYSYYIRISEDSERTLPVELALRLLTHQSLFQRPEAGGFSLMDAYFWEEIAKTFIQNHPEKSLMLAGRMLEHFGEDGTILDSSLGTHIVLDEIIHQCSQGVWKLVTKYLGPPTDSRAFHIKDWLQGGMLFGEEGREGALLIFPPEMIWKWVDEDIENHAWYIASFVPKRLSRKQGEICLAREVLVRYGAREDVRRNLIANFLTETWWGPASLHFQEKKQKVLSFGKEESDENVNHWIDEYVSILDREIEQARIREEREGF